ncbi:Phosphoglycerate mutase [Conexivisphaera calida]|uniref:Phosphoglycerate mutase n=1 Tax=Conexivisphaera calida TaxID=1874277 RepID=A0A4V0P1N3_9ARCH|nr:Phosphoglycerate mutase [Conexivisphaera calida]
MSASVDAEALVYTDGASRGNPGPCAYAFLIIRGDEVVARRSEYLGRCTNNEAEYTAVARAMEEALRLGIRRIRVHSDSRLVISQLTGRWRVKDPRMRALSSRIKELASKFEVVEFVNVPREDPLIRAADHMCNRTLDEVAGDFIV